MYAFIINQLKRLFIISIHRYYEYNNCYELNYNKKQNNTMNSIIDIHSLIANKVMYMYYI